MATSAPGAPTRPPGSPTARILPLWRRFGAFPMGKRLFSWVLGRVMVPYTGSVSPQVEALEPGYARVVLRDRRAVRNHLNSIHAIALANVAEAASGLAVMAGIPADTRGILTGFRIEYLKKARGTLVAECRCEVPSVRESMDFEPEVVVRDEAGDVVVRAWPKWRLGPVAPRTPG